MSIRRLCASLLCLVFFATGSASAQGVERGHVTRAGQDLRFSARNSVRGSAPGRARLAHPASVYVGEIGRRTATAERGQAREVHWPTEYLALRRSLADRGRFVRERGVPVDVIRRVERNLNQGDGQGAWGVVLVDTAHGPAALKLIQRPWDDGASHSRGFEHMRTIDEAIIQDHLAQVGVGLPVRGVLDEGAVRQLLERHPEIWQAKSPHYDGPPRWGYLVDYVPDAYNPKVPQQSHGLKPPPPHAVGWDRAAIGAFYDRASESLDRLGVRAYDFQVLISRAGHPQIIDAGHYLVLEPTNTTPDAHPADHFNSGEVRIRRDTLLRGLEALTP